jgi:membrane-bound ClpP family serine protease
METLPPDLTVASSGPNKIGYLHLEKDHAIDSSTVLYVKFALDHFKKEGVKFVVLDLDTPGGEVFAAIKICEMLKNLDLQDKIPVIAYIDNWAISAGAMIAYSCRYIGITSSASMGAAEPILIDANFTLGPRSESSRSYGR